MAVNPQWGKRLREAKRDYERRHDTKLSYREIGERVSAVLGRPTPFTPTAVRAWFLPGQEPETFALTAAIATVLEADPRELVFGPERGQLSVAEIAEARRIRDAELAAADRLSPKRRRGS